jgi:hypothetical protein
VLMAPGVEAGKKGPAGTLRCEVSTETRQP